MIPLTAFAGRKVAVFGLGGSGMVSAHALTAGGAEIVAFDDRRETCERAWNEGLPVGDLRVADFSAFDALVLSPGVPLTHPAPHWTVEKAKAAGIEIVGDVELFDRERRARLPGLKLAAITGTNGKSTTTALLGHLLKAMGLPAQVGGNIGRPVLDLDAADGIAVVEVSSFQIDLSPTLTPDAGAVLNVTEDHLDRHGTFANYAAIKRRLAEQARIAVIGETSVETFHMGRSFRHSGKPCFGFGVARFRGDDPPRAQDWEERRRVDFEDGILARSILERRRFDESPRLRDVHVGWRLVELRGGAGRVLGELPDVASLKGDHNVANAAAALAMVLALGLDPAEAVPHLATFAGLPHRMEEVGRDGSVVFVNDSKATNAQSARQALSAFDRVLWIAGGRAKEGGIASLSDLFGRVERAYLIGESAQAFASTLSGAVPTEVSGTLEKAVEAATRDAAALAAAGGPPPVVLLSPACASFDQFASFEERGERFRALVRAALALDEAGAP